MNEFVEKIEKMAEKYSELISKQDLKPNEKEMLDSLTEYFAKIEGKYLELLPKLGRNLLTPEEKVLLEKCELILKKKTEVTVEKMSIPDLYKYISIKKSSNFSSYDQISLDAMVNEFIKRFNLTYADNIEDLIDTYVDLENKKNTNRINPQEKETFDKIQPVFGLVELVYDILKEKEQKINKEEKETMSSYEDIIVKSAQLYAKNSTVLSLNMDISQGYIGALSSPAKKIRSDIMKKVLAEKEIAPGLESPDEFLEKFSKL